MVATAPHILIADDEIQLLRVLVRVMEDQGYAVISAPDGKAAVEATRQAPDPIDAIVIDAAIGPEGAGAVLEALDVERRQIGVIVTSGDQLPDPLRTWLNAHGGVFLLKPFLPNRLVEAVEGALARRGG